MSRLNCPGCGRERGVDIRCRHCGSVYCSESCLRWHYWRKHASHFVMWVMVALILSAFSVAVIYQQIKNY